MTFTKLPNPLKVSDAGEVREKTSIWEECKLLLHVAVPTVIVEALLTLPAFLASSYVGRRYGHEHLSSLSLALLTGNLSTLAFLNGLFMAADTLSPQAFAVGNYRQVGLLAIRGFALCMTILVPINVVLWMFMKTILVGLGEDEVASEHAWRWYQIFAFGLPFHALFVVTWKFLTSQLVLWPLVAVVTISTCLLFPVALYGCTLVYGFLGSAVAFLVMEVVQAGLLLACMSWKQMHHPDTWPGLAAWKEAISWDASREYLLLGFGGMLASSEWIYWEVLALLIGTLGVLPLSVHTIPTQVITITYMLPYGVGGALALRIGAILPYSVSRARSLAWGCQLVSMLVFGSVSVALYVYRRSIYGMFTNEPEVMTGCEEIWWMVCLYYFILTIFAINMGISTGLGLQWVTGITTIVFIWIVSFPGAYYFAIWKHGGLFIAWYWIWPPYAGINGVLAYVLLRKDWKEIAAHIRYRGALESGECESLLLHRADDP